MLHVHSAKLSALRADKIIRVLVLPAIESSVRPLVIQDQPTPETNRYAVMVERKSGRRSYQQLWLSLSEAVDDARTQARERKLTYVPWPW